MHIFEFRLEGVDQLNEHFCDGAHKHLMIDIVRGSEACYGVGELLCHLPACLPLW